MGLYDLYWVLCVSLAIKLVAILLAIIGFALQIVWIAVVLGFFVLVAWLSTRWIPT